MYLWLRLLRLWTSDHAAAAAAGAAAAMDAVQQHVPRICPHRCVPRWWPRRHERSLRVRYRLRGLWPKAYVSSIAPRVSKPASRAAVATTATCTVSKFCWRSAPFVCRPRSATIQCGPWHTSPAEQRRVVRDDHARGGCSLAPPLGHRGLALPPAQEGTPAVLDVKRRTRADDDEAAFVVGRVGGILVHADRRASCSPARRIGSADEANWQSWQLAFGNRHPEPRASAEMGKLA